MQISPNNFLRAWIFFFWQKDTPWYYQILRNTKVVLNIPTDSLVLSSWPIWCVYTITTRSFFVHWCSTFLAFSKPWAWVHDPWFVNSSSPRSIYYGQKFHCMFINIHDIFMFIGCRFMFYEFLNVWFIIYNDIFWFIYSSYSFFCKVLKWNKMIPSLLVRWQHW